VLRVLFHILGKKIQKFPKHRIIFFCPVSPGNPYFAVGLYVVADFIALIQAKGFANGIGNCSLIAISKSGFWAWGHRCSYSDL
jgi:hypothetical protein